MVSNTLWPAVHILGSKNVYSRAEGIAETYWPRSAFRPFTVLLLWLSLLLVLLFLLLLLMKTYTPTQTAPSITKTSTFLCIPQGFF